MSDTSVQKDVVEDGGIKCSIPVINKLFAACASGEAAGSAPKTPGLEAPKNDAQALAQNGGLGNGGLDKAATAIMTVQKKREMAAGL
ncbi:MAG: hypothetical protein ACK4NR_05225 [Micavibrio sp.]